MVKKRVVKRVVDKEKQKMKRKRVTIKESEIQDTRGSLGTTIFSILFLLALLAALVFLVYMLYMNIPGEPLEGSVNVGINSNDKELPLLAVKQFYPNTKFNHKTITYNIDINCDKFKEDRILEAFNIVSEKVPGISFKKMLSGSVDIEVSCSDVREEKIDEDHFIAGEGGAKEIIQTGKYNVITNGVIFLYESENSKTAKCNYPDVELHELMHVFGFEHSEDKNSLMYPYLETCDQILDESIIKELNRLYSEENLPDLFFEDVWAVRRGKYLDFNLTIKNSGVIDSTNVKYSILDDGELVQTRELDSEMGEISFGAGVIISITNLKLINRNSKEIVFVIDRDNKIKEYDEENNRAVVRFG